MDIPECVELMLPGDCMGVIASFLLGAQVEKVENEAEEPLFVMISVEDDMWAARDAPLHRIRWNCKYLTHLAQKEGTFVAEYRLTPQVFNILVDMLTPALEGDKEMAMLAMAKSGSGQISIASRIGCALIMLGGGRHMEAMRTHGVSQTFVYENLQKVVNAINDHPGLAITCSNKDVDILKRADAFAKKSSHKLFKFCVGSIGGLAITIRAPSRKKFRVQKQFMSGSKKKFCLNMQGNVCYSVLQLTLQEYANYNFIGLTCLHVGSTSDNIAFETSSLQELNESLPFPFHWNGDNAYVSSRTMMVPYSGVNLHQTSPEFLQFLSQPIAHNN